MSSSFGTSNVQPDQSHDLSPRQAARQSPDSGAPDLAALAASLQQIAHSLLALAHGGPENSAAQQGKAAPADTAPVPPEIRVYSLADYIVREEKALLAAYHAEDWQELFYMARNRFETIYNLMRHFHEEEVVNGFLLQQIAQNLMAQPLEMLTRLCSLVADFRAPEAKES